MLDPLKDIVRLSGLPDPVLHILLGLGIYLAAAALLRLPLRSWIPWLIVLAAQLINEAADILRDLLRGYNLPLRGGLLDTVVTMFLPSLIVLVARFRNWLESHGQRP